jgi:mRNA interferase MazF
MAETRRTRKDASPGWPKRGEIYLVALDTAVGPRLKKTRTALVIQNDKFNRDSAVTMVVPIISTVRRPLSPLHVALPAGSATGLTVPSVALFNQINTIDRKRLVKKLGAVNALVLARAEEALKAAFGLTLSLLDLDLESPPTITDAISRSTRDFKTGRYEG